MSTTSRNRRVAVRARVAQFQNEHIIGSLLWHPIPFLPSVLRRQQLVRFIQILAGILGATEAAVFEFDEVFVVLHRSPVADCERVAFHGFNGTL